MTAAASPEPQPQDRDRLVQVNVRIPAWLRDEIDARRATVNGGISRDKWAARAFKFALAQPRGQARQTAPGMRTAPPPHRR